MVRKKLSDVLIKFIWILFTLIIGYLLLASVFSTSYIGELLYSIPGQLEKGLEGEHTFYLRDNYVIHILFFGIFSFLLVHRKAPNSKLAEKFYCIVIAIISIVVVVSANKYPVSDQMHIMEIASAMNAGDYSATEPGGYLFKFPFQYGIVLFYQLMSLIFGNNNYIAFQILNAFFIGITYYFLFKILGRMNLQHSYNIIPEIVLCLYTPYVLYVVLIYGNVIALMLATMSFYYLLRYDEFCRIKYMLLSSALIALSAVLKTNYVIFLIAEIVFLLCGIGNAKDKQNVISRVLFIFIAGVMYIISKKIVDWRLFQIAGENIQGIPMVVWIAMGLQDGKKAPGWYNGYIHVYEENNWNYSRAVSAAVDSIKATISSYADNLTTMTGFYVKKVASIWNDPIFASICILGDGTDGKSWIKWLVEGRGRYLYTWICNVLQTWILTGAFFWCVFRRKYLTYQRILLPVTFIGGFIFHLFWEGKSMYAIPYFILLFPLCVLGYQEWREYLVINKNRSHVWKKIVIAIVVVCLLSNTIVFKKLIARNDDDGIYNSYTQEVVDQDGAEE